MAKIEITRKRREGEEHEWTLEDQLFMDLTVEDADEAELMDKYFASMEAEDDEFDEDE